MDAPRIAGIVGVFLLLISLFGLPWYIITVRVERNISYVFIYSPFFRKISLGDKFIETQWFYRADAIFFGVLCIAAAILPQILRSQRVRIISSVLIILVLFVFVSLLPIHVATAPRLSLGFGLLLAGSGAVLLLFSAIFS